MGHYVDLLKKTLSERDYGETYDGKDGNDDSEASYKEIDDRHAEAKRLGISPDELLKRKVDDQKAKLAAKDAAKKQK